MGIPSFTSHLGRRMGETRPGIKSMKKTVGQQHHKEVAQVHPVPGTEVLELKEYVVGSGPTDITLSSAPTLKLTARHREPLTTRRKVSDETKEEIQEEDEATLRELLMRYANNTVPLGFTFMFTFVLEICIFASYYSVYNISHKNNFFKIHIFDTL